jgi:hypothetical protein
MRSMAVLTHHTDYLDRDQTNFDVEHPIGKGSNTYLDSELSSVDMSTPRLPASPADLNIDGSRSSKLPTTSATDAGPLPGDNDDDNNNEGMVDLGTLIDSPSATAIKTKISDLHEAIIAKEEELRAIQGDYSTVARELNELRDQLSALSFDPRDSAYATDSNRTNSRVMLNGVPTGKRHRAWYAGEPMIAMRYADDPMLDGLDESQCDEMTP